MSQLNPSFDVPGLHLTTKLGAGAAEPRILFSTSNIWASDAALPRALRRVLVEGNR